ncbi:hybrid sensor histidine kinase/response regulator transcription factor [Algibacter mikhailovii]|uniref:hybrid sensor histidine kinase/response regulator transcription factor n=1 Tax=Algibacter mikhailovii TaxID=425498 RepID=UPI00249445CD|nr:hybrid sensor histidine kinase/response regulator transcription factor [Algibacter mikhailovii]
MNFKSAFLLLFVNINVLFAQLSDYNFRDLNVSNGLSNNTVSSVAQDKLGQMWFATSNGLNKFNGRAFTVYRNIPGNINSLSSSEVLNVMVDRDGFVWAGTINGLNKYNPENKTFKRYYRRPSNKNSLSHSLVISSLEMRGGNIWFGTANGVSIYEKKKDRFIRFLQGNAKAGYRAINDIIRDENNIIWLATNNGIIKVERDQSNKFSYKTYNVNKKRTDFIVNSLLVLSPNTIGVATKHDGYLIFNTETEQFSRSKGIDVPNDVDVKDLEIDDDNNLWLGTTNGLFIITPSNKTVTIAEGYVTGYASIQNFIKTIHKNKNGFIWIGTQNGGIITWDKSYQNFRHFKNENLKNNITNSIVGDDKSNIYFATDDGVINELDKSGNISELVRIGSAEKNIDYAINSICHVKPNLLFIGTANKGLLVYDLKEKKLQPEIITSQLKDYVNNVAILDIKGDSQNNVYIGTFGKGIVKYNIKSKSLQTYIRPLLATNIIKSIQIVEKDNLLVGGTGGLTMLDLGIEGKPKAKIYLKNKLFKTLNVNAVYKDSNNSIWAGTKTNGLYKLEGDAFKRVSFPRKNQFTTVNSILEGDKGVLWLSTDSGILKYNTTAKSSILYDQKEVLSNNDFRPNSSLKIDGQIYFGDLQGITTFNPKKIIKSTDVQKVVLSELKIKNEIVPISKEGGILSNSLNYTDVLELDYNNSNFSISYALLNYVSSNGNRYAYRLKGLDDTWTYTYQTEAFFTLQTAGTYSFQVKAANHDDVWSKRTSLEIIVHPAPWKTWWAYTIYILLAFAILYGITWMLQSKSRLRHKLELESIENKRNLELNKAKLQFFTNISHEFRTPLTLILGPLQNILDDYTGSNVVYKKLKVIESSANHLLRLINRLMDFRKLESNQLKLAAAEGNIVKFLQEIYLSFSEHAKIGDYNYEFNTSDNEIFVYYDRYKLERVFYNLISNAFKYTENGGYISLNIYKEEKEIIIEVKDSGDGIPEKYLDKIFDRFFEIPTVNETDEDYKKGTGIGLSIASNIVKLHHGKIFAKNVKPHGSVFTVKLKLGRAHLSEDDILDNFKLSDDVSQYAAQINVQNTELSNNPEDLLKEKKKYTILIVEDNIVLRSFIKEILKPNYNVLQAENGKIALEKAIKHLPDLIVSDVMMPEMVGTELCSKIKTTLATSHIPVILLTSRSALVYKFEGLESGADDYISKPFNLKEFNLKINNLLEAKQRLKDKFSSDHNLSALDISLTSLDEQLLEKAFKIVKENIANQDFNIAQFCEELGVSRSMLFTKIKAWTNSTPNDFIQEIRLNHAAKLLEFNKLNISEVSYQVGFKRPKYFSQCFQKKYGLTPSEFSKKFANWEQM